MGLCSAKAMPREKKTRKIECYVETTGHTKLDMDFEKAVEYLKEAEKIRLGIEESKENAYQLSNIFHLQDPHFCEAIKILFWSISANHKGEIEKSGLQIHEREPYLSTQSHTVTYQVEDLHKCIIDYVETVAEGPKTVDRLIRKYDTVLEEITSGITTMKNDMPPGMNSDKAAAAAVKNLNHLKTQDPKVKRVKQLLEEAEKGFPALLEKMNEYYKTADEVGVKAAEIPELWPKKIFEKFHTGLKKNPKEIADLEKHQ
jgi:hypothetical protein